MVRRRSSGRPRGRTVAAGRDAEGAQHRRDGRRAGALGRRQADVVGVDQHAGAGRPARAAATTSPARPGTAHGQRVEPGVVDDLHSAGPQGRGDAAGVVVGALRDPAQALGTVVDGVHRRHDREQHLRGADVGRRLVAADVLLAGLEGEPVGRAALRVDGHPHQPAGQVPLETGRHRHVAGVRTAVEEGYAEALRRADHDVGAEGAGRLEQGEGEEVGRDDGQGAALVRGLDDGPRVADGAGGAGVLDQHAAQLALGQARRRGRRR